MRFLFKKIITWTFFWVGFYLFIKYGYILPKFNFIINLFIVVLLGLLIVLFIVITILKKYYSHRRENFYFGKAGFDESSNFGNAANNSFYDPGKNEAHFDFELKYIQDDNSGHYVYDEKSGIWIPHSESNSGNFHHISESELWIPHSENNIGNVGFNRSFISSSAETNKETFNSSTEYRNIKIVHENANNRNPSNIKIEIRNFVVSVLSGIIASIFFHYLSDLLNWH